MNLKRYEVEITFVIDAPSYEQAKERVHELLMSVPDLHDPDEEQSSRVILPRGARA